MEQPNELGAHGEQARGGPPAARGGPPAASVVEGSDDSSTEGNAATTLVTERRRLRRVLTQDEYKTFLLKELQYGPLRNMYGGRYHPFGDMFRTFFQKAVRAAHNTHDCGPLCPCKLEFLIRRSFNDLRWHADRLTVEQGMSGQAARVATSAFPPRWIDNRVTRVAMRTAIDLFISVSDPWMLSNTDFPTVANIGGDEMWKSHVQGARDELMATDDGDGDTQLFELPSLFCDYVLSMCWKTYSRTIIQGLSWGAARDRELTIRRARPVGDPIERAVYAEALSMLEQSDERWACPVLPHFPCPEHEPVASPTVTGAGFGEQGASVGSSAMRVRLDAQGRGGV